MIPTAEHLAEGYRFIARRFGIRQAPSLPHLEIAARSATALAAGDESDEPAALFFALARNQAAFGALWTLVTSRVVQNHARSLGLDLTIEDRDLLPFYVPISRGARSYDEVRDWFRARMPKR